MRSKLLTYLLYGLLNWYAIKSKLLTIIGDIRFSIYPLWLMYVPQQYAVKGKDIQQVLKVIQPGDIILRGYNKRFVDGLFIPNKYGCSHAGLYVGNDTVIHAVAQGVSPIHLIDFCQADKVAVFRAPQGAQLACARAKAYTGVPYDFSFTSGDQTLYCFQLAAVCYKQLHLKKHSLSLFGMKLPKVCGQCYLDKSFYEDDRMKLIIQVGRI